MIRVAIVEDEPLAREGLRLLLGRERDVEIVGEAADTGAAIAMIRRTRPDLALLDVRIPGGSGFDVLEAVAGEQLPLAVFVTAHDEHAVRAFDVHALDYLLKPVDDRRFHEAIARAREALARAGAGDAHPDAGEERGRLASALDERANLTRFVVRERGRHFLVSAELVDWIGAAGNYVELHVAGGTHLVRGTIAEFVRRLDPARFARVHRSAIVQIDRIRDIVPDPHGDFELRLKDGSTIRMSRNYRGALLPRDH